MLLVFMMLRWVGLLCVRKLPEQNVGDDEDCGCDETADDCHECHKCFFEFGFHGFVFGLWFGFVVNLAQLWRKLGWVATRKSAKVAHGEKKETRFSVS